MKKVVLFSLFIVLLFAMLVPAVTVLAHGCVGYTYNLLTDGRVLAENFSNTPVPTENAEVFINGVSAGVFAATLPAHSGILVIGAVVLPSAPYDWQIVSSTGCSASGSATVDTPPVEPPPVYQPPPTGQEMTCITLDKGNLWGKLTIWMSNPAREKVSGFDGYAEVNHDGALTVFANPNQSRTGYFLVEDEHGVSELFYIENGMDINCLSILNHDCVRVYPVPPPVQEPCACEVKP